MRLTRVYFVCVFMNYHQICKSTSHCLLEKFVNKEEKYFLQNQEVV